MPYEIAPLKTENVVRLRVFGATHLPELDAASSEALAMCRNNRCRKMLVDLKEMETSRFVSTIDWYEFGKRFARQGSRIKLRVAFVAPVEAAALRDVRFISSVIANRGIINRELPHRKMALAWLMGGLEGLTERELFSPGVSEPAQVSYLGVEKVERNLFSRRDAEALRKDLCA